MSNLAPGVLLVLLGAVVLMRSVVRDDTGRTLIDRILGQPGATAAASGKQSPGAGTDANGNFKQTGGGDFPAVTRPGIVTPEGGPHGAGA